ncbi:MAG: ABC transporter substrate-binding protein [Gammaproteobacteria bacterium]
MTKRAQRDRRKFLKQSSSIAAIVAAPMILTSRKSAAHATELNMLAWYGHGEPDIVEEFEARNNVKFKPKYYAGGDNMLALIAQSPPGTYDVILSDAEFVQQLNEAGYIEELNPADYPFDDLWPEYENFPGHWKDGKLYSVIVRFGYLGVSFNTTVVSHEEATSYDILWDKKLTGKVGHFDWHLPNLGCLSLRDGNSKPSPFDIGADQWGRLRETTLSLKPQVAGFFDYGGTFASLKNGEVHAMCGIGDWITGVLLKDGAPVDSVVPKQGGIQWTESFSIGKGSKKQEMVKKFIQYMTSPPGQVRSAQMAAYPGMLPYKSGWKAINEANPDEARRQRMVLNGPNCIDDLRDGRIHFRRTPVQQSLEDWNDFWSEYKNA